jgi:hypothetical protein
MDSFVNSTLIDRYRLHLMHSLLSALLLITASIAACVDLRELFVGWYSGVDALTAWQTSLLLARAVLCIGVVVATTLFYVIDR